MRRRRRAREGQEKRKRENRRLILKKLCAALLRSFRRQHSEKMKESARGKWDPREGQQQFRPNPNGVGDRTTTLRRLLIGAVVFRFVANTGTAGSVRIYFMYSMYSKQENYLKRFNLGRDIAKTHKHSTPLMVI